MNYDRSPFLLDFGTVYERQRTFFFFDFLTKFRILRHPWFNKLWSKSVFHKMTTIHRGYCSHGIIIPSGFPESKSYNYLLLFVSCTSPFSIILVFQKKKKLIKTKKSLSEAKYLIRFTHATIKIVLRASIIAQRRPRFGAKINQYNAFRSGYCAFIISPCYFLSFTANWLCCFFLKIKSVESL